MTGGWAASFAWLFHSHRSKCRLIWALKKLGMPFFSGDFLGYWTSGRKGCMDGRERVGRKKKTAQKSQVDAYVTLFFPFKELPTFKIAEE